MPVKGINLAVPATYLPEEHAFPENMRYWRGQMEKRFGMSKFGDVSIGAQKILHLATFETSTNVINLLRHTRYNIEKYNTSTSVYNDITGTDMSGDETDFFSSTTITEDDIYIFTNYIDNIRKWTTTGNTQDLGGDPPKAKFVEYVTPYLLIANLEESGTAIPTKLRWSGTSDPEQWTGGNSGSQLLTHESSPIRGMKKMGDFVFIYKEKSIYRGRKVSTTAIFDVPPYDFGKGLLAPRALAEANGVHYYMGLNDFYVNDGIRTTSIGSSIREFLFNRINRELAETFFAIHASQQKEIWFFITTSGNSWPNEIWKYKYDLGFWYSDTVSNILTGTEYKVVSSLTWDDSVGTWDSQVVAWDDVSGQADAPQIIMGDTNGLTYNQDPRNYNDNVTPFTGKLESKDYTGLPPQGSGKIGIEEDQRWMQLDLWASGSAVKVYYSKDGGDNWTYIKAVTLTSSVKKYTCYFDIVSDKIRFKFENGENQGNFILRSFIPYYLGDGDIPNP